VLETAAADLGKLNVSTPELKKFSADYTAMCKETAASFHEMLTVVASMEAGKKKLEGLSKAAEANMQTFEQLCTKGRAPAECRPVAKKLKQFPDDPNKIPELDKFIDELRTVKVKNAALKALVADFVKNLTDTSVQAKQMQEGEAKIAATAATLKKVSAKESAIVDGLNAFCGAK